MKTRFADQSLDREMERIELYFFKIMALKQVLQYDTVC
jgi:hypothetical protein